MVCDVDAGLQSGSTWQLFVIPDAVPKGAPLCKGGGSNPLAEAAHLSLDQIELAEISDCRDCLIVEQGAEISCASFGPSGWSSASLGHSKAFACAPDQSYCVASPG